LRREPRPSWFWRVTAAGSLCLCINWEDVLARSVADVLVTRLRCEKISWARNASTVSCRVVSDSMPKIPKGKDTQMSNRPSHRSLGGKSELSTIVIAPTQSTLNILEPSMKGYLCCNNCGKWRRVPNLVHVLYDDSDEV